MLQINVLPAANPLVTTMMGFPEIGQDVYQWVNQQRENASQQLTSIGQQFLNQAQTLYQHVMDGSLSVATRKIARAASNLMHPNMIGPLDTIREIQTARPVMQRYIMANPALRSIYHRQLCDGYSDTYVDMEPTNIGEDHYDYRRVMNGMVQQDMEKPGHWKVTEYFDSLIPGDRELDDEEQFTIWDIWEQVETAIAKKIDPTDIFGSELGI